MAAAIFSVIFPSDPTGCLASNCVSKSYKDLIITKCNHIFCRDCLEQSLARKKECPICRGVLTGQEECTNFKPDLDVFTYYVSRDLTTLTQKLQAAKVEWCFLSCKALKEALTKKSPSKEEADTENQCSICHDIPFQMYFIIKEKTTRHMHENCWQKTVNDSDMLLSISASDLPKVVKELPYPKAMPPEPVKPASPVIAFFVMIFLPLSIWALAMNARVYYNKNIFIYLLSFPALVIFKILSLLLSGVKAIFTEKQA